MLTWYKEGVRARETEFDSAGDVPPSDEKREEAVCVCGCAIVAGCGWWT